MTTERTHWEGCWRERTHHECAVAHIAELEALLLEETVKWYDERKRRETALAVCEEQAEDDGLWFDAQTATENYLQRALRRLHAAVESKR